MDYYAASVGSIAPNDMRIFLQIQAVLTAMPNISFGLKGPEWLGCNNQLSCHLICRALAKFFEVSFHNGYFTKGCQHSWLIPSSGSSIIDAYPFAGASPFIVARNWPSPWGHLYIESSELDQTFSTNEFRAQLEKTTQIVGDTIGQLSPVV